VNPESPLNRANDAQLARLLEMKKGFRLLREVDETSRFFFIPDEQITYDAAAIEKVLRKNDAEGTRVLRELQPLLAGLSDWSAPSIEAAVTEYGNARQLGLGKVAQPLRVAISGSTVSPPIFDSLEFLEKHRTIARIDRCLSRV
jgi:glutamyl-tRNA synthetase